MIRRLVAPLQDLNPSPDVGGGTGHHVLVLFGAQMKGARCGQQQPVVLQDLHRTPVESPIGLDARSPVLLAAHEGRRIDDHDVEAPLFTAKVAQTVENVAPATIDPIRDAVELGVAAQPRKRALRGVQAQRRSRAAHHRLDTESAHVAEAVEHAASFRVV